MTVILSGFFLIAGCAQDQNVNTSIDDGAVGGVVSVRISDGRSKTQPIYTWSYIAPDGSSDTTAMKLKVARVSDLKTSVWDVFSPSVQDNIGSGVTHGVSPPNSTETVATERDLTPDVWYRVTITKLDPSLSGYHEFRIKP
ncbi:MAG: hypothetical protein HY204_00185 [Nitrospirae bacterium]|nr:hypothetical protein [Nitrospirota bacterium]